MATAWTEETGGLQSIESQRVRHDLSDLAYMHIKVDQDMWSYLCKLKMYSTYINFSFLKKIKIHIKIIWQLSTLVGISVGGPFRESFAPSHETWRKGF